MKIYSKFIKPPDEIKVKMKADVFVNTLNRVNKEQLFKEANINLPPKETTGEVPKKKPMPPPPPSHNSGDLKKNPYKLPDFKGQNETHKVKLNFSNSSTPPAPPIQPKNLEKKDNSSDNNSIDKEFDKLLKTTDSYKIDKQNLQKDIFEEYFRETIIPAMNEIKSKLSKYEREGKVSINNVLMMGSMIIEFQKQVEFQYSIQLKSMTPTSQPNVIVRASNASGGMDIRNSFGRRAPKDISKDDIIGDFLIAYKSVMKNKVRN